MSHNFLLNPDPTFIDTAAAIEDLASEKLVTMRAYLLPLLYLYSSSQSQKRNHKANGLLLWHRI